MAAPAPASTATVADRGASIAVLPFADLSEEGDKAYFSDGLSEELIDALAGVEGLRVAARTSSFAFRDSRADVRTIADSLGVANVLEGSVRVSSPATGDVAVLGPGNVLGALSLVTGGAHRARAETTSRASLLRLPPAGYRRLADAEPRAACELLEAISREAARLAWRAIGDPVTAPRVGEAGRR